MYQVNLYDYVTLILKCKCFRIDTCIVGDDSTCDQSQNEVCRIESNISSCNCRPGFARTKHREVCQPSVSIVVAVRVDRVNDRRILWVGDLKKEQSELYQSIAYELGVAVSLFFLNLKIIDFPYQKN